MSKHTPGPWIFDSCYRAGYTIWGGTASEPVSVVDTLDNEGRYGAIGQEANARLIAAAPELLEALQALDVLFGHLVSDCTQYDWIDRARTVIAKATGVTK